MDNVIGTVEVAAMLGMNVSRVRALVYANLLSCKKISGTLVFDRDAVTAFKKIPRKRGRPSKK